MKYKILRVFLVTSSIAVIGAWIYILLSLKAITTMDPVAMTDNLVGIAYTAGVGLTVFACVIYACIYTIIILPIMIIASYKGIWHKTTQPMKPTNYFYK